MSCLRHQTINHWDGIMFIHLFKINHNLKRVFMIFFPIKTCIYAIYKYCNMFTNGTFTKNFVILGSPGGDKTWRGMYVILYTTSKVLKCNGTAIMCKKDMQICVIHYHKNWPITMMKILHHIVMLNWDYWTYWINQIKWTSYDL